MKGRKPELRVIEGGGIEEVPPAPAAFSVEMADEWNSLVADLMSRKVLEDTMLGAVETYIIALVNVRKAQKAIEDHGVLVTGAEGALKPNPASGLLWRSQAMATRLASELGLTPASRSKPQFQKPKEEEDDLFSQMGI